MVGKNIWKNYQSFHWKILRKKNLEGNIEGNFGKNNKAILGKTPEKRNFKKGNTLRNFQNNPWNNYRKNHWGNSKIRLTERIIEGIFVGIFKKNS